VRLVDSRWVSTYWKKLIGLKKEMSFHQTQTQRNKIWMRDFDFLVEQIRLVEGEQKTKIIILGLVLVHHDFCYNDEGEGLKNRLDRNRSMITLEHEKQADCQIGKLKNAPPCIFNLFPEFRKGVTEGDHFWPYSLGGPSNTRIDLTLNRVLLCRACNRSKSNSVYNFDWETEPEWLIPRLRKIRLLMTQ